MSSLHDMVAFLEKQIWFPEPRRYDRYLKEGLLAVGGDLSVRRLKLAYEKGIFPWTDDPITWWCPQQRGVFELNKVHVSRSLRRVLNKQPFDVTFNTAFDKVIEACAKVPRPGGWITPRFIRAYQQLHDQGCAHSVECWCEGSLVGGVYGVQVGAAFAGESMFYRVSNASKIALLHLLRALRDRGWRLVDIQMLTPVTQSLGALYISRETYLDRLETARSHTCTFPTGPSQYACASQWSSL